MKKHVRFLVLLMSLVSCVAVFALPAYAATNTPIVVSMGDSYSGGEGLTPYYGQDSENKYFNQDWIAHRSSKSWSSQLVIDGYQLSSIRATPTSTPVVNGTTATYNLDSWTGGTWFFVASSGGELGEIVDRTGEVYNVYTVDTPSYSYTAQLAPQIEVFDYINKTYGKGSVDYVTISLGGMELGFEDLLVQTAINPSVLLPNMLNNSINELKAYYQNTLGLGIAKGLLTIREAAGPQAKIIICGYPELFATEGSSLFFSSSEMQQANAFALWIDQQLSYMVQQLNAAGYTNFYYVSLIDVFSGHGAYTRDPWINSIIFGSREEDLIQSGLKSLISPSTFHPNVKGAQVIAAEVQKLIDRLEASTHAPGWAYEGGSYYYYENDGSLRKNAWASYNGIWYYFGKDGKLVANGWALYNGSYYYLKANGKPAVSELLTIGGTQYYFNNKGVCIWKSA